MKKLGTALITIALCIVLVFTFAACQPGNATTATAYGYVHGGYAATATVSKDSATSSGYKTEFNEYYLPANWANASIDGAERTRHEKVMVGSRTWTNSGTAANGYYMTEDNISVRDFIKDPVNAEWYVKEIVAGNFWILDASGNKIDDSKVSTFNIAFGGTTLNKTDSLNKVKNGYWPGEATTAAGTIWNKQFNQNLAGWLNTNGYAFSMKDITSQNSDGYTIGNGDQLIINGKIVTGVTSTDVRDYIVLAYTAYSKLVSA